MRPRIASAAPHIDVVDEPCITSDVDVEIDVEPGRRRILSRTAAARTPCTSFTATCRVCRPGCPERVVRTPCGRRVEYDPVGCAGGETLCAREGNGYKVV